MERGWELGLVSLEKGQLPDLTAASQDLKRATGETGEVLYQEAFEQEEGRLMEEVLPYEGSRAVSKGLN